jgi:hypothetical protein
VARIAAMHSALAMDVLDERLAISEMDDRTSDPGADAVTTSVDRVIRAASAANAAPVALVMNVVSAISATG